MVLGGSKYEFEKMARHSYCNIWGLEPKSSLEKFGLKRIIKPKVQNPSSNFQKRDLIYSRIIRWIK